MFPLIPLTEFKLEDFEQPAVLKRLGSVRAALAELKGVIHSIPNEAILNNALGIQEAKESSEIENIVTTHDELFQDDAFPERFTNPATKEVQRYRQALKVGYDSLILNGLLTTNRIVEIQEVLERNSAGLRTLPGTTLRNSVGQVVYTPPQDPDTIIALMRDLEIFINDDNAFDADPLIKMAIIHHQFESIHPFYDGNGRTGRILNVLYLVKQGLLNIPVLYLSRYINRNKGDYYRLLQAVRESGSYEEWIMYVLNGVELTSIETISVVSDVASALQSTKHRIRNEHKFYSQDLINSLFMHPYTKIEYLERDLNISRPTATKYLDTLSKSGILEKRKIGRTNYYINQALTDILTSKVTIEA